MNEPKTLYYRLNKDRDHHADHKYQLLEFHCDIPKILGEFRRMRDLKKYAATRFSGCELNKIRRKGVTVKKPLIETTENVYLLLDGKAIRKLSWGMSWKKVTRLEQIEGDEAHLKKNETISGCDAQLYFGFNDWANSGLEYITYSSLNPSFLGNMQSELTKKYGKSETIVDFRGLDRMLKKGEFKNERLLSLFLNNPNSPFFNRMIKNNKRLTFRSARKWETENTIILAYKKLPVCPGERNAINFPHVVEFLPRKLFEFFEEAFAQLFIHV